MMRLIAPVLLATAFGTAMPLAVGHAQSAATAKQEASRSWAKFKGWTQPLNEVQEKWDRLTDDDIQEIDGRREVLIVKLQARYTLSYEDAERQVGDFEARRP